MPSDAGGKKGYVKRSRWNVYEALRKRGHSKKSAAQIANAGVSKAKRSKMARKAAKTRKRRR